jgi:hypothetical protein
MANREIDPLESQVRILFGRSSGRCAYPQCGLLLVLPSPGPDDMPKNIAKVGHITAASAGGPRYDASLPSERRRSIDNLILLCSDHHDAIDTQLHFHTVEFLQDAKRHHEEAMERATKYAMGQVGFKELQMVCDGLVRGVNVEDGEIEPLDPAPEISQKLVINDLGDAARHRVELGLAQQMEVRKFLVTVDNALIGFSARLTAHFKSVYYANVADGLHGNDLFDAVLGNAYSECGPTLTAETEAAALAVVAHLFSICEIFEHELAATQ